MQAVRKAVRKAWFAYWLAYCPAAWHAASKLKLLGIRSHLAVFKELDVTKCKKTLKFWASGPASGRSPACKQYAKQYAKSGLRTGLRTALRPGMRPPNSNFGRLVQFDGRGSCCCEKTLQFWDSGPASSQSPACKQYAKQLARVLPYMGARQV